MRPLFPILVALLSAPVLFAQSTVTAEKSTITAEAVEVMRAKPDQAKLYFTILIRNNDATTAGDENTEQTKQFADAIDKLKLKGVKASGFSQRLNRVEIQNRMGGNPNPIFVPEYHAARTVVVSATDPDPDRLQTMVEKVQQEAAKQGVGGETGGASYNGMNYERNAAVRVVYSRRDGWDDQTTEALKKATKKALTRAEAMAAGAGLKVGEVVSIGEPGGAVPQSQTIYNYSNYSSGVGNTASAADSQDEFTDGELVRRVRVRVVVAVGK